MSNVHRNRYAAAGGSTLSRHVTRVTCVRARDFSLSLSLSLSLSFSSFLCGCECDMCESARTSRCAIAVAESPETQKREKEGYEVVAVYLSRRSTPRPFVKSSRRISRRDSREERSSLKSKRFLALSRF